MSPLVPKRMGSKSRGQKAGALALLGGLALLVALIVRGAPCELGTYWAGNSQTSLCVSPLSPSSMLEWFFNPTSADLGKAIKETFWWLGGLFLGVVLVIRGCVLLNSASKITDSQNS